MWQLPHQARRGTNAYQTHSSLVRVIPDSCLYRAGANSCAVTDGNSCITRSPNANPFAHTRSHANVCANADLKTPAYGDNSAAEYPDSNTHVNANPGADKHACSRTNSYSYIDT